MLECFLTLKETSEKNRLSVPTLPPTTPKKPSLMYCTVDKSQTQNSAGLLNAIALPGLLEERKMKNVEFLLMNYVPSGRKQ